MFNQKDVFHLMMLLHCTPDIIEHWGVDIHIMGHLPVEKILVKKG